MNREQQLQTLLEHWKEKLFSETSRFNEDGIVDVETWDSMEFPKILYVLKETNNLDGSLVKWLMQPGSPASYGALWPRIAEWTKAIHNPMLPYCYSPSDTQNMLKNVAIMNIKKTPGGGTANPESITQHVKDNWDLISQQIELIDPDVVVFCGTWGFVSQVNSDWKERISPEKCFWRTEFPYTNTSKRRLLIEFWHPAARYPAVLMYYGIQGIYRSACVKPLKG